MRVGGSGGCGRGVSALPLTPPPPASPSSHSPPSVPPSFLPLLPGPLGDPPHTPTRGATQNQPWYQFARRGGWMVPARSPALIVFVSLRNDMCARCVYTTLSRLICMRQVRIQHVCLKNFCMAPLYVWVHSILPTRAWFHSMLRDSKGLI